jgi:hypothetical protein
MEKLTFEREQSYGRSGCGMARKVILLPLAQPSFLQVASRPLVYALGHKIIKRKNGK